MQVKWEIFQKLHERLKQNKIHKHTKLRIIFSMTNGQRKTKECTFQGLLTILWNIYESNDFIAIAIFIIKDKNLQPIFKYAVSRHSMEKKPQETGNQVVKYFKELNPKARSIYADMAALKIQEEIDERFNI